MPIALIMLCINKVNVMTYEIRPKIRVDFFLKEHQQRSKYEKN